MKIYSCKVYEKFTGEAHLFEVFDSSVKNSAPYVILLDGSFFSTAENGPEIGDEIENTVSWFDWTRTNPNYA